MVGSDHDTVWPLAVVRPTIEDRLAFQQCCHPAIKAAAHAMHDRVIELGFIPTYGKDDAAWHDLADIALKAAAKHG